MLQGQDDSYLSAIATVTLACGQRCDYRDVKSIPMAKLYELAESVRLDKGF